LLLSLITQALFWPDLYLFRCLLKNLQTLYSPSSRLRASSKYTKFVGAAASNLALITNSTLYQFTLFAQVGFYALAIRGYMKSRAGERSRIGYMPYYFMLLNLASAHAFGKFVAGKKQVIWEPRKG
jgi:hypothetical protein